MSWLNLEGKVVIVTGAVSGIGREIATVLAENGSIVIVADISQKGQDVISKLPGGATRHIYVQTDVTKRADIEEMVKKAVTTYERIDILVNNAGINLPRLLVDPKGKYELHEEEFDRMVAINQKGPYLCTQVVVKEMIKRKIKGVIINIASECGLEGSEGQSCYAATKGALYAFTRSWAKELGKFGIRVVGVAPGTVEKTGIRTLEYEEALAFTRGIKVRQLREGYKSVPLGRVGKLREVANLVCFLASNKASYVNGTTYNISGGRTRG